MELHPFRRYFLGFGLGGYKHNNLPFVFHSFSLVFDSECRCINRGSDSNMLIGRKRKIDIEHVAAKMDQPPGSITLKSYDSF